MSNDTHSYLVALDSCFTRHVGSIPVSYSENLSL
jgi:hypothetical protein